MNGPVAFGGRIVTPGDLVIGDDDGLVALLAGGRSVLDTFDLPPARRHGA